MSQRDPVRALELVLVAAREYAALVPVQQAKASIPAREKLQAAIAAYDELVADSQPEEPTTMSGVKPNRILVDAAGYVWRDFGEGYLSMAPSNPDNEPLPEPVTVYLPVKIAEALAEEPTT